MIWTKIEIMYLASYWLLYSYRPFFSKSAHQPVTEKKEKKEEGKTEIDGEIHKIPTQRLSSK